MYFGFSGLKPTSNQTAAAALTAHPTIASHKPTDSTKSPESLSRRAEPLWGQHMGSQLALSVRQAERGCASQYLLHRRGIPLTARSSRHSALIETPCDSGQ